MDNLYIDIKYELEVDDISIVCWIYIYLYIFFDIYTYNLQEEDVWRRFPIVTM